MQSLMTNLTYVSFLGTERFTFIQPLTTKGHILMSYFLKFTQIQDKRTTTIKKCAVFTLMTLLHHFPTVTHPYRWCRGCEKIFKPHTKHKTN